MAKEEKKDLPSGDMAGLMTYLVRPVRELEDKIDGVKKQFDERIHYNLLRVDDLIEAVKGHDLSLKELVREPKKLENRISLLEGKAKGAEPLAQGLSDCGSRVSKLEQQNAVLYGMNKDLKDLGKSHLNLEKEVRDCNEDQNKKLDALHDDSDANRRGLQALRDDMGKRFKADGEDSRELYQHQAERIDDNQDNLRMLYAKVNDFNNKVDQASKHAASSLRLSYEDLHSKNEELRKDCDAKHEKVLNSLEKLSFLAEKDEHRDQADAKRIQILEMQVENLELAIKELKLK